MNVLKRRRLNITTDEPDLMEVQTIDELSSRFVQSAEKPVQLVESDNSLDVVLRGINPKLLENQELSNLKRDINQADERVKSKVKYKLELISQQIAFLQKQAVQILQEGCENIELNHAACNFRKVPENIYHLYEKPSGQKYFSVLSPQEWNYSPPHLYCGSYKYNKNSCWEKVINFEIS